MIKALLIITIVVCSSLTVARRTYKRNLLSLNQQIESIGHIVGKKSRPYNYQDSISKNFVPFRILLAVNGRHNKRSIRL